MKRYFVVNGTNTLAVRLANFSTLLGYNGTFRCTLVRVSPDLSKMRGFTKRAKAEAAATKATEYCNEKFIVISNKD